jgi:hypothetical protein
MKLDKDFLIKQKFWVVLGGGLFLTLLATFFLLVIAPGAIGKKRKEVEDSWKTVKDAPKNMNPTVIEATQTVLDKESGFEKVAHGDGYETQKHIPFWPKEFEAEFEIKDGLFATEIAVQANSNLAEQPADEPKEEKEQKKDKNGKNGKNGKKEAEKEPPATGKFYGKLVDFNAEYIVVQGRGSNAQPKTFHKIPQVKVTFPEERKDPPRFTDLADKKGAVLAVSYFRGRRFYDPMTPHEQERYAKMYRSQLRAVLDEVGALNELGDKVPFHERVVVQFPGYTWGKELPDPVAPFFRHVKEWDVRDKDISEEAWLAQEDLWIQRELFRIVKMANDSVANFEPVRDAKKQPVPGSFVNPYWRLDVLEVKDDKVKIKLTNRLDRPQAVQVNFRVQFQPGGPFVAIAPVKDNDPLPPAGTRAQGGEPKDSLTRELTIEGDPGKQVVGVRQVLTWETAAVRRIDHVSIGRGGPDEFSLAQRNAHRKLKPFRKKPVEEKPAEEAAPMGPGRDAGKAGVPGPEGRGGRFGPGGVGGGAQAELTPHGLVEERYFDVTPQARRVPVAVVLIVDQAQVSRVETAFADSPLRFLTNQVLIHRYPRSVRPDTSAEPGGADAPAGVGPTYPMGPKFPSGPGILSPGAGFGGSRRFPGLGGPSMPERGGRLQLPGSERGRPSPGVGYPGTGMPGYGYGFGAQPPDAAGSEEQESNVELVVYGIISLYEPYPLRPPLAAAEAPPAQPTPEAGKEK